jgi:hypothetical protein
MQIDVQIPVGLESAVRLKAKRTGKTVERILRDALHSLLPLIGEQELSYKDIAQIDDCHVVTVKKRAAAGVFGKLIRRSHKDVRVSLQGYLKWKHGKS